MAPSNDRMWQRQNENAPACEGCWKQGTIIHWTEAPYSQTTLFGDKRKLEQHIPPTCSECGCVQKKLLVRKQRGKHG